MFPNLKNHSIEIMNGADHTYHILSSYLGAAQLSNAGGRRAKKREAREAKIEERKAEVISNKDAAVERKAAIIDKKMEVMQQKQDIRSQKAQDKAMLKEYSKRYLKGQAKLERSLGRADKKRSTGEANVILAEQGINARAQMAGSILGGIAKVGGAVGGSIVGAKIGKSLPEIIGKSDSALEESSALASRGSNWEDGYSTPDSPAAFMPGAQTGFFNEEEAPTTDDTNTDSNNSSSQNNQIMETIKKNKYYIIGAIVVIAAIWYYKKKK